MNSLTIVSGALSSVAYSGKKEKEVIVPIEEETQFPDLEEFIDEFQRNHDLLFSHLKDWRINGTYYVASEKQRIDTALKFLETVPKKVEHWVNPFSERDSLILHGLGHSDLSTICRDLRVGGFSHLRTDNYRHSCMIFDPKVVEAYVKAFPKTDKVFAEFNINFPKPSGENQLIGTLKVLKRYNKKEILIKADFNDKAPEPWKELKEQVLKTGDDFIYLSENKKRKLSHINHLYGFLRNCVVDRKY